MTDWENYDSGPFCRHWSDPADCEEVCECGHHCTEHVIEGGDTGCNECECDEWKEL